MACADWTGKLDAYLDRELPAADERALREHMRTCAACAADALERMQMKRAIQAAGLRFQPDPDFRIRIQQTIATRNPARSARWRLPLLALSAAAVLLAAGLGVNYLQDRNRQRQVLSELVDLHVATLGSSNPVEVVSSDRHTVKPWFEGKVPFTFDLPELQGSEFSLIGGRTSYLNRSAGAELIFRLRQHNISVFIFPENAAGRACSEPATSRAFTFNVSSWRQNGLCYFAVGDVNAEDLQKLTGLLKSSG